MNEHVKLKELTDPPLLCDFTRGYYFGVKFFFRLEEVENHFFWFCNPRLFCAMKLTLPKTRKRLANGGHPGCKCNKPQQE